MTTLVDSPLLVTHRRRRACANARNDDRGPSVRRHGGRGVTNLGRSVRSRFDTQFRSRSCERFIGASPSHGTLEPADRWSKYVERRHRDYFHQHRGGRTRHRTRHRTRVGGLAPAPSGLPRSHLLRSPVLVALLLTVERPSAASPPRRLLFEEENRRRAERVSTTV